MWKFVIIVHIFQCLYKTLEVYYITKKNQRLKKQFRRYGENPLRKEKIFQNSTFCPSNKPSVGLRVSKIDRKLVTFHRTFGQIQNMLPIKT